jgi:hypothetical protein
VGVPPSHVADSKFDLLAPYTTLFPKCCSMPRRVPRRARSVRLRAEICAWATGLPRASAIANKCNHPPRTTGVESLSWES